MTKRAVRPKEGSLVQIALGDGRLGFGRVLPQAQLAMYAHTCAGDDLSLCEIYGSKVIFIITVMKDAFRSKNWKVLDFQPLEPFLLAPVQYFVRDAISKTFSIYSSDDGSMKPATFEEVRGLENAAAWEAHHVEDRLRDFIAGRPNPWHEQLRAAP